MKTTLTAILLLVSIAAQADVIISQTFAPEIAIPDGNPVGIVSAGNFTMGAPGETVGSITVGFNLSGGYNGDLYAYLVAPNGTLVVLMNQPGVPVNGFGASGAGMNITLDDTSANPIQNETGGATLAGSYQPDQFMGSCNNSSVNGTWDLYFADMVSGGGSATLDSFSLNIDVVPERVTPALCVFALLLLPAAGRRMTGRRRHR